MLRKKFVVLKVCFVFNILLRFVNKKYFNSLSETKYLVFFTY